MKRGTWPRLRQAIPLSVLAGQSRLIIMINSSFTVSSLQLFRIAREGLVKPRHRSASSQRQLLSVMRLDFEHDATRRVF